MSNVIAVLYLAQRFSANIVVQITAARLKSHFFIKLSGAEIFFKDPQEYIVKSQMLQFIDYHQQTDVGFSWISTLIHD